MFKIDKSTHMMIMFTFAIVFVVVYLYFTITDVRKMQRDMVRLSEEVLNLQKMLIKQQQPTQLVQQVPKVQLPKVEVSEKTHSNEIVPEDEDSVVTEDIRAALECSDDADDEHELETATDETAPLASAAEEQQAEAEAEAEAEAQAQVEEEAEIKSVHSGIDEPHFEFNIKSVSENEFPSTKLSVDEIKALKYDELRQQCRAHDLHSKGTKDSMIQRLIEHLW
jgi:hypothetical protein